MQKRIALLYDFDYTLADGFMQEFGLMQDLGHKDIMEYFKANEEVFNDEDMDMCLVMMGGLLVMAKQCGKVVTRDYLRSIGKNVKYYPGVEEWFDKINKIGEDHGYTIEHYVISKQDSIYF